MNGEPAKLPRVRFNAEVNLGHVLQVLFLVGAIFGAYVRIENDLADQRGEYRIAMATLESRVTVAEHAIIERRSEEREFAAEMRDVMTKIQSSLADLRVQMAQRHTGRER